MLLGNTITIFNVLGSCELYGCSHKQVKPEHPFKWKLSRNHFTMTRSTEGWREEASQSPSPYNLQHIICYQGIENQNNNEIPLHTIPTRTAKIQRTDNTNSQRGCGATGALIPCWVGMQHPNTATLEDSLTGYYKMKHSLTIGSSNHTPRYHPTNLKIYVHTKTRTQMFRAPLFIIANNWKQPRCPSVGEWMNRLQYNQTMEYLQQLEGVKPQKDMDESYKSKQQGINQVKIFQGK